MPGMEAGEITMLLQQVDGGDNSAADALYRLVQSDLRAIAGKRKKRFEDPLEGSTTVLVDDAFCKLVGRDVTTWRPGDRGKFFSYAATKIHDMLVESARARGAQKRGGDRQRYDVNVLDPAAGAALPEDDSDFVIDLKTALDKLSAFAEAEVRAFRIYYFLGSTFEETAEILGVSATEAKRLCKKAQMWLQRELKEYSGGS